jgi:hypothetical protein
VTDTDELGAWADPLEDGPGHQLIVKDGVCGLDQVGGSHRHQVGVARTGAH